MSATDDLLANAARYAAAFDKPGLPAPPARRVAVLACMDARLIPTRVLGLDEGDAHVIRNAGGVVSDDAIRSLAISQRVLGTEEIVLLHHTDCGMLGLDGEAFRAEIARDAGVEPDWPMHTFGDLDENLRASMARLRESPFLPRTGSVRGFVFDVETGALREVR